jgi:CSLREA domain-containing protein
MIRCGAIITRHPGSKTFFRSRCLFLAAVLTFFVLRAGPTIAATFTVNTTADLNDLTPGNGLCVAYLVVFPPYVLPFCSLRGAIEEANALPGPDRIILQVGEYTLDIPGTIEDGCGSGDLDITDSLILSGAGTDETVIDAAGLDRVLDLFGPDTEVTISGLTIRNGSLPPGLSPVEAGGGGVRNGVRLTLNRVTLQGNMVNGASLDDIGGGLYNTAVCVLRNATVDQNRAAMGGGIANLAGSTLEIEASTLSNNWGGPGAGLFNEGTATVINSTFSGNRAQESGLSSGGGLMNRGVLDLIQSTVANNQASEAGGGISNQGEISMINTLLAGNRGGNCDLDLVGITSLGHNLDSDATCGLSAATDLSGMEPKIDALAPHGGPTRTHGLLLGSPAVDRGKDLRTEGVSTDQRGSIRPQGRTFDIGALETAQRSLVPLLAPLLLGQTH